MISVLVFSFYPHFLSEKIPKTMIFSQIPSLTWSSEEVLHRELAEACSSLSIPFTTCERKKDYWWNFTVKKFFTFYLAKKNVTKLLKELRCKIWAFHRRVKKFKAQFCVRLKIFGPNFWVFLKVWDWAQKPYDVTTPPLSIWLDKAHVLSLFKRKF